MIVHKFRYRYGHSEVNNLLFRIGKNGLPIPQGNLLLRDAYFQPTRLINEGGLAPVLRGSVSFPSQAIDIHFVNEIRNELFPTGAATPGKTSGFDLPSINIQRGRDHGLPDLNTVRRKLGFAGKKSNFD